MTDLPQAIDDEREALANIIVSHFGTGNADSIEFGPNHGVVFKPRTIADMILAAGYRRLAAPGQSATDIARSLISEIKCVAPGSEQWSRHIENIAQAIAAFAAAQVAAETERCARIADEAYEKHGDDWTDGPYEAGGFGNACDRIAKAIRARQAP